MARLEAVLLLSHEPLPSRKLAALADLSDGTEARTLCRKLNTTYDNRQCAFRVEQVAGGYQLLSRPQYNPWLRRLHPERAEVRLSGPALETLAVIAYRQPILRAEVEAIRGVQCGEILRQLMDRDLVRIAGKSNELGRPFLYATTKRFLQVFGLKDLDELPRADLLRKSPVATDGPQTAGEQQPMLTEISPQEKELDVKALLTSGVPVATELEAERLRRLVSETAAEADEDEDLEEEDDDLEDDEDEADDEEWEDEEEEEEEWEEVEDEEGEEEAEEEEEWDEEDEEWDDDEEWEDDDEEWDEDEEEEEEEEEAE